MTHSAPDYLGEEIKRAIALRCLDLYRSQARLVITTRLHCALPCIAMGIPVVFFGDPDDHRLSILRDLKVPVHRHPSDGVRLDEVDWDPPPLDVEGEKEALIREVQARLSQMAASSSSRSG